eukprot:GILI01026198.1.p1 GENE.GILI01026198.1~~GILI01026198.1.p1  ORF type:complete len:488 (+),score=70.51 GILI01026198.1:69-1466(+)
MKAGRALKQPSALSPSSKVPLLLPSIPMLDQFGVGPMVIDPKSREADPYYTTALAAMGSADTKVKRGQAATAQRLLRQHQKQQEQLQQPPVVEVVQAVPRPAGRKNTPRREKKGQQSIASPTAAQTPIAVSDAKKEAVSDKVDDITAAAPDAKPIKEEEEIPVKLNFEESSPSNAPSPTTDNAIVKASPAVRLHCKTITGSVTSMSDFLLVAISAASTSQTSDQHSICQVLALWARLLLGWGGAFEVLCAKANPSDPLVTITLESGPQVVCASHREATLKESWDTMWRMLAALVKSNNTEVTSAVKAAMFTSVSIFCGTCFRAAEDSEAIAIIMPFTSAFVRSLTDIATRLNGDGDMLGTSPLHLRALLALGVLVIESTWPYVFRPPAATLLTVRAAAHSCDSNTPKQRVKRLHLKRGRSPVASIATEKSKSDGPTFIQVLSRDTAATSFLGHLFRSENALLGTQ